MMKRLSLFQKLGTFFLVLAVCVLAVGCGGSQVDALVKERKAIDDEIKANKGDLTKAAASMAKIGEWAKKVTALSVDQQKELKDKLKKEGVQVD